MKSIQLLRDYFFSHPKDESFDTKLRQCMTFGVKSVEYINPHQITVLFGSGDSFLCWNSSDSGYFAGLFAGVFKFADGGEYVTHGRTEYKTSKSFRTKLLPFLPMHYKHSFRIKHRHLLYAHS